jgi:hypothetical protein
MQKTDTPTVVDTVLRYGDVVTLKSDYNKYIGVNLTLKKIFLEKQAQNGSNQFIISCIPKKNNTPVLNNDVVLLVSVATGLYLKLGKLSGVSCGAITQEVDSRFLFIITRDGVGISNEIQNGEKITLRSNRNNRFIVGDVGNMVNCNRLEPGAWELFTITKTIRFTPTEKKKWYQSTNNMIESMIEPTISNNTESEGTDIKSHDAGIFSKEETLESVVISGTVHKLTPQEKEAYDVVLRKLETLDKHHQVSKDQLMTMALKLGVRKQLLVAIKPIQYITVKLIISELPINPFLRGVLSKAASFTDYSSYFGIYHTGISINGMIVDWNDSSLAQPRDLNGANVVFAYTIHTIEKEDTEATDKFLTTVVDMIVEWNMSKMYNKSTCNCQQFVEELCTRAGISYHLKGSAGSYMKQLRETGDSRQYYYISKELADRLGEGHKPGKIEFKSHKEVDEFMFMVNERAGDELKNSIEGKQGKELLKAFCRAHWAAHKKDKKVWKTKNYQAKLQNASHVDVFDYIQEHVPHPKCVDPAQLSQAANN